jgi:hypothetical protein
MSATSCDRCGRRPGKSEWFYINERRLCSSCMVAFHRWFKEFMSTYPKARSAK